MSDTTFTERTQDALRAVDEIILRPTSTVEHAQLVSALTERLKMGTLHETQRPPVTLVTEPVLINPQTAAWLAALSVSTVYEIAPTLRSVRYPTPGTVRFDRLEFIREMKERR